MSTSHVGELDVALLRALVALVSEQHVTRAARRLGVTQSALSHSLGRLRRIFGDPLFVRTPTGMRPTERALALAPEAERLVAEIDRLAAPREALDPRTLSRTFVVGCHDFGEATTIGPLVVALAAEAPQVDLAVRQIPDDADAALAAGRIDLLLGRFADPPPSWVVSRLYDETYVTMMRRGHPALREKLTPARFAALGHALIAPGGGAGGVVDDILATRGLRRRVVVRLSSFAAAPLVVSKTDLVITLPTRIARQMSVGLPVELLEPPIALPKFTIQLAFHALRRRDPAHAWFRSVVERVAKRV